MPAERKLYPRAVKLILTATIAFLALMVIARLKYGDPDGWRSAIAHLWSDPRGTILFFIFFPIFFYDCLSIIAFNLGLEKESDELEWHPKFSESGEVLPREHKIFSYPFALLLLVLFI